MWEQQTIHEQGSPALSQSFLSFLLVLSIHRPFYFFFDRVDHMRGNVLRRNTHMRTSPSRCPTSSIVYSCVWTTAHVHIVCAGEITRVTACLDLLKFKCVWKREGEKAKSGCKSNSVSYFLCCYFNYVLLRICVIKASVSWAQGFLTVQEFRAKLGKRNAVQTSRQSELIWGTESDHRANLLRRLAWLFCFR